MTVKIKENFVNKVIGQVKNTALAVWESSVLPLYTIRTKANNSELVPHTVGDFSVVIEWTPLLNICYEYMYT